MAQNLPTFFMRNKDITWYGLNMHEQVAKNWWKKYLYECTPFGYVSRKAECKLF